MAIKERHPITYPMSMDLLAEKVAQLWDQVWWLSLPPEKRAEYEAQGFVAPIQTFYEQIVVPDEEA